MMNLDIKTDTGKNRASKRSERGPYAHLFSEYLADEMMVVQYWEALGCSVQRLDSEDKRNPDFSLAFANGSSAICEVKSFGGPETVVSDYALSYSPHFRISNALYTGIRQLLEYEVDDDVYRILFFVNHNDKLKFGSFQEMLGGEWDPIKKEFVETPTEWSTRCRAERNKIDLYLWLQDTPASSAEWLSQCWGRVDRRNEICQAMQLNPKQISLIQAA